ncbi:MAG: acetyltransferase [Myxococcota bacterium]|nr:acetyltransferase [Myxococcota bacterium]
MRTLWILGAGGHAKVVIATARAAGFADIEVADDRENRWGETLLGCTIRGPVGAVLERPDALAVLAIGSNATRYQLAARARCELANIVHPATVVDPTVTMGAGTVVFAGAIIQPDSRLGTNVIVNTGALVDHDASIGDAVHLAPGTRLAGSVTLEDGVFMGIGASIIPGCRVGAWATIGAGAVVINDLAAGITAVGAPARPAGSGRTRR